MTTSGPEVKIVGRAGPVPLHPGGSLDGSLSVVVFRMSAGSGPDDWLCLYHGPISEPAGQPVVVRLHSACLTGDLFGSRRCDCQWQLDFAIKTILRSSAGVLLYAPTHEGRGSGLFEKVRSFELMDEGMTSFEAFERLRIPRDRRDFRPAGLILRELGVARVELMTNNPAKVSALRLAGVDVAGVIDCVMPTTDPYMSAYLGSKLGGAHVMADEDTDEEFR